MTAPLEHPAAATSRFLAVLQDVLPDCQDCAACCHGDTPRYVRVDGSDHLRLSARAEELTEFHGNRCYMSMAGGHCVALQRDTTGRYACGTYETRPEPCRALERGSPSCDAERLRKG
jgi:Fe-S-cluster containining protein